MIKFIFHCQSPRGWINKPHCLQNLVFTWFCDYFDSPMQRFGGIYFVFWKLLEGKRWTPRYSDNFQLKMERSAFETHKQWKNLTALHVELVEKICTFDSWSTQRNLFVFRKKQKTWEQVMSTTYSTNIQKTKQGKLSSFPNFVYWVFFVYCRFVSWQDIVKQSSAGFQILKNVALTFSLFWNFFSKNSAEREKKAWVFW